MEIFKPLLFENEILQPCIGISKPVSNEELIDILDKNKHSETMTAKGGVFGTNVNIFTLEDGTMIHSAILNMNEMLVFHALELNEYKVRILKKRR